MYFKQGRLYTQCLWQEAAVSSAACNDDDEENVV